MFPQNIDDKIFEGVREKKKKEILANLVTGPETIIILYYLARLRDIVQANSETMQRYFAEALKNEDLKDVDNMMKDMDIGEEDKNLVRARHKYS